MKAKYMCSGDRAVTVEFGETISEETAKRVSAMKRELEMVKLPEVEEVVQTYRSLLVYYDPIKEPYEKFILKLKAIEEKAEIGESLKSRHIEIPIMYGGEFGSDLKGVSKWLGIPEEEIVKRHLAGEYLVHMIGFTPGFPYMGGLDKSLAIPRKEIPRLNVPPGSVGIAGDQTGIYPVESPGGWSIIGRTPIKLYDPQREKPVLLESGDRVIFREIGAEEYRAIENGEIVWEI